RTDSQGQLILPMRAQEQLPKDRVVRVLVLVDERELAPADPSQEQLPTASPDEEHLWYGAPTVPYDGI
ncbi:hypothetical protein NW820_09775, partial [Synechococcus sp. R55.7]|uniref:hypothetical protein n=1 Tax=Synechococcus sp. R55.7 TaxID=2964500 RepID=UPI0039C38953